MPETKKEIAVRIRIEKRDGPIYDYLEKIPRVHRGYELKKIILGQKGDAVIELPGKDGDKREQSDKGNAKENFKF